MATTPEHPHGADELAKLRTEIDELKAIPEDELISPLPSGEPDRELEAEPTDAIGSEKWDEPADQETLDQ